MQVNVYGAFHVLQRVLRHMQEPRSGKVVNIASTAGKWGSMNQSAYNASKHAVVGLTRCAALEMGAHGINVNAICPGFVQTDMLESFRARRDLSSSPKSAADSAVSCIRMLDLGPHGPRFRHGSHLQGARRRSWHGTRWTPTGRIRPRHGDGVNIPCHMRLPLRGL
jgi:NAD(P)-dependent dehydrogenase (short-subunit alcohol dehydrogenase family)